MSTVNSPLLLEVGVEDEPLSFPGIQCLGRSHVMPKGGSREALAKNGK